MPSVRPIPISLNLRTSADLHANDHAKPDTRRFGAIFTPVVSDAIATGRGDVTDEEERDENSDDYARRLDSNTSTAQADSIASIGRSSTLSAAQQVIASYRAIHGNDQAPACTTAETTEKELPEVPDDHRSMYTLATPASAQSNMDMMWKPQPKVHLHRNDQRALNQAQSEAIAMMHDAGLKPTDKIQCRRHGCADILPSVEGLKYHIHIHNIASATSECGDASPSAVHKPSLAECSTPDSTAPKTNHSRSKSSFGTQHKHLIIRPPSRKPSAGSLFPSLFSPRESTPEVQHVPSITTVTNAFVSGSSPNKRSGPLSTRNNQVTPPRGRRTRKEIIGVSVDTECNPSIAMLLSPPSSPTTHSRLASPLQANLPVLHMVNPVTIGKNDNGVFIPSEDAHPISENFTRTQSPTRALSPTRAMSPIRNGIRRVLSIGHSDDFMNE